MVSFEHRRGVVHYTLTLLRSSRRIPYYDILAARYFVSGLSRAIVSTRTSSDRLAKRGTDLLRRSSRDLTLWKTGGPNSLRTCQSRPASKLSGSQAMSITITVIRCALFTRTQKRDADSRDRIAVMANPPTTLSQSGRAIVMRRCPTTG